MRDEQFQVHGIERKNKQCRAKELATEQERAQAAIFTGLGA